MSSDALTQQEWIEIDRTVRRFGAANRVSIIVGLVLVPLLFGGIGGGLWAVIPAPFGMWVGGSILGAGGVMLLFLLWYRHRTLNRPAFAAQATIVRWIVQQGRHGQESYAVEARLDGANAVGPEGLGQQLPAYAGATKKLRLTSKALLGIAEANESVMLLCMPTEEVVAIHHGGELTTA